MTSHEGKEVQEFSPWRELGNSVLAGLVVAVPVIVVVIVITAMVR